MLQFSMQEELLKPINRSTELISGLDIVIKYKTRTGNCTGFFMHVFF
jgi:hypothetical protein